MRYWEISVVIAHEFAIPRFGLCQLIPHQCQRVDVFECAGCVKPEGSIPARSKAKVIHPICGGRVVLICFDRVPINRQERFDLRSMSRRIETVSPVIVHVSSSPAMSHSLFLRILRQQSLCTQELVGYHGVSQQPGAIHDAMRETRLVVLPRFQGKGQSWRNHVSGHVRSHLGDIGRLWTSMNY